MGVPSPYNKKTVVRKCLKCNKEFDTVDPMRLRICPPCTKLNQKVVSRSPHTVLASNRKNTSDS